MSGQENVYLETESEFVASAPSAEEAAQEAKDDRVWYNDAGEEVSKSEFIREQFTKHNKSRKQISEEFNINYRTVYGATLNMVNDAEPATRGRGAGSTKINVTADGHVISVIDGVTHVDNVAVEDDHELAQAETTQVDRNEWIREQVASGRERSEVAAALGLSYGVVYQLTKDQEGSRQTVQYDYNGEKISRSEYIRRLYGEGKSRADIAKELGVEYSVVWSALKTLKSDEDKFAEAIDKLAKFADLVENREDFEVLIEQLREFTLKQEEAQETSEGVAESAAE